eukprot:3023196-Amphidinium_carterae.1
MELRNIAQNENLKGADCSKRANDFEWHVSQLTRLHDSWPTLSLLGDRLFDVSNACVYLSLETPTYLYFDSHS